MEVRDQSGDPLPGVQVAFSVSIGGGMLSATSATTDVNGRAESILTLGPNPGANTVEVGVTGIQEKQSVSAIAELPPIPQDVNGDDVVNILDLVLVASVLGDGGRGFRCRCQQRWGREHPGFGIGLRARSEMRQLRLQHKRLRHSRRLTSRRGLPTRGRLRAKMP